MDAYLFKVGMFFVKVTEQAYLSLHLSKCHIVGNHVSQLNCFVGTRPILCPQVLVWWSNLIFSDMGGSFVNGCRQCYLLAQCLRNTLCSIGFLACMSSIGDTITLAFIVQSFRFHMGITFI